MLSKKINIQKSFRIEINMENDLEILSKKLNRPQNDLVNIALNQLLLDNIEWFVEDFLIDLCKGFLEKKVSELIVEITGFKIRLNDDGENIRYSYDIETNSFSEHCSSGIQINNDVGYAIITNELKEIALKIGAEAPEVQEYLRNRFSYLFARESIIQCFDRDKFIKQSVGFIEES